MSTASTLDFLEVHPQNEHHTLDFKYAAQISIWLLKPIGAWPLDNDASRFDKILYVVSIVVAGLLQIFMIVPWCVYLITAKVSFYDFIRTACPLIFAITVFVRYVLLLVHRDQIKSCIDRVAEDWRNAVRSEDRAMMLINARSGRLYGICSVAFMYGSGILYCSIPMFTPAIVTEDNVTIRALANPCELLIFDSQATPVYEMVLVLQFVSGCILYSIFCGICSLTAKLITHVCGQCQLVMSTFEAIVDGIEKNHKSVDKLIGLAVARHLRVLRFVSDMEEVFNEICLAEFINSSCNICLLGYYVIMDWNNHESMVQIFMYFLAFVSITFNIYIFCYIGDLLVEWCKNIGNSCYMIEWYRLPQKRALSLILPMAMSHYPSVLTAGKMMTMTMDSFSNILKASLTYFNLLREVLTRDNS